LERRNRTPGGRHRAGSLTQCVPDHTYVTALHLAGNKLHIVGITRDAPSLIPPDRTSQHFTCAHVSRSDDALVLDPGERFHSERGLTRRTRQTHGSRTNHHPARYSLASDSVVL